MINLDKPVDTRTKCYDLRFLLETSFKWPAVFVAVFTSFSRVLQKDIHSDVNNSMPLFLGSTLPLMLYVIARCCKKNEIKLIQKMQDLSVLSTALSVMPISDEDRLLQSNIAWASVAVISFAFLYSYLFQTKSYNRYHDAQLPWKRVTEQQEHQQLLDAPSRSDGCMTKANQTIDLLFQSAVPVFSSLSCLIELLRSELELENTERFSIENAAILVLCLMSLCVHKCGSEKMTNTMYSFFTGLYDAALTYKTSSGWAFFILDALSKDKEIFNRALHDFSLPGTGLCLLFSLLTFANSFSSTGYKVSTTGSAKNPLLYRCALSVFKRLSSCCDRQKKPNHEDYRSISELF